ncbi:MAG: PEGA domain-containing protein [Methanolinea sp.]|nr:PEGA domain-containing protein [Methanolinea sp.]
MKYSVLILCILCTLMLVVGSVTGEDTPGVLVTPEQTPPVIIPIPEPIGGEKGYFSIESNPPGADVIFDGKFLGETPVVTEVSTTAKPSHSVSISKYGYNTWTRTYTRNPAPGETITIVADLQPVVQTGTIQVSSSPAGAIARLDGGETLVTPGTFRYVPPGNHAIEISMAGYLPFSTSVSVSAGGVSSVSASLTPLQTTGLLRVTSSPSGADVYVDDIYRGYTPMTVGSLSAGRHSVRLKLAGYQDYTQNVDVPAGNEAYLSASLSPVYQPTTGDILVSSVPDGAAIYLDGNYRGMTVPGDTVDITGISPGTHTITLLKSGYQDYTASVTVAAGSTSTVTGMLKPGSQPSSTGGIIIQSTPSGAEVYIDNVYKGFSPLFADDIPTGFHVVTFKMKGYTDVQQTVQVNPGESPHVTVNLQPVPTTAPTKSPVSLPLVACAFALAGVLAILRKK